MSYYSDIVKQKSATAPIILEALATVEKFISEKKRIVVGGFSIDAALRLCGSSIYDEHEIPDYDMYSPTHSEDAYELADILQKLNFHNISVINAYHPGTMRVRIDFEVVADITYSPPAVYQKLPFIQYKKLRIIHPHFQMIDQHRSLSHPYENPGREVIFQRWKKDMTRYDLLYEHYPVGKAVGQAGMDGHAQPGSPIQPGSLIQAVSRNLHAVRSVSRARDTGTPINTVRFLASKLKGMCLCGWGTVGYSFEGDFILLKIPAGEPITFASDRGVAEFGDAELYDELFDKIPRKAIIRNISHLLEGGGSITDANGKELDGGGLASPHYLEILDTSDRKISARPFGGFHICNLQYTMLYLMVKVFIANSSPEISQMANDIYLICRNLVMLGEHPSIETYGRFNVPATMFNSRAKAKEQIYHIKPDPRLAQPAHYYPARKSNVSEFNYAGKEFFKVGGERTEAFMEHTADPYPEYNSKSTF